MSDFPDILGMELHDAAALLEAEGLTFVIEETKAVKGEVADGALRVVRVLSQSSKISPANGSGSAVPVPEPTGPGNPIVLTVCRI